MAEKKSYSPPQLFRVALNQEQAILSACSLTTTSAVNGGTSACRSNCKKHSNSKGADSGPRPS